MKKFENNFSIEYPTLPYQVKSYSDKIEDYQRLSKSDKKILIKDILEFQRYVFWFQNLPCPTYDQMYMQWYVGQSAYDTERRMLQAQRSLAKSLCSQILVTWLFLRNKEEKIAVLSATGLRSESWTTFLLNLIRELPVTKHMYPSTNQRQSGKKFDINGCKPSDSPSLGAYSITGQKTGMRATFLVYDDVEIPENSDTAGKRDKLSKGVRDSTNLGIAHVYRSLCLCTPQSSETIYEEMIDRGYKCTIIPAEYTQSTDQYNGRLAPHIQYICDTEPNMIGKATDARLNERFQLEKKMELTTAEYKLQYLLDTSLSDEEKYPLKLNDLIVMDLDREKAPVVIDYGSEQNNILYDIKHSGFPKDKLHSPRFASYDKQKEYEGIMMYIDPSGRGKDATAYAITAQINGKIFLLDFGGVTGGYDINTLIKLATLAKDYKVNHMQIESNFGDGAFHELMKPVLRKHYIYGKEAGCFVEDVRAVSNKERRIIETLEPILNQHRLIVNKSSLVRDYESNTIDYRMTYQLTHLTAVSNSLKHDDIIDAIEGAVSYWKQNLAREQENQIKQWEEEQLQKEIEEFEEEFGISSNRSNIMNRY